MRIKTVQLSWFRGAADSVSLEPDCKSMVVYGANGSGKSSFVDAVEYVLKDGKIGHLAHEYSGKRQEKAVPNTHTPKGRQVELRITFKDDSELKIDITPDGSSSSSGAEAIAMGTWDYRRTVLRQDEVGAFIHETKGGKYSALLPLLGLHHMEVAAENLRQMAKLVSEESKLREIKIALKEVETKRRATFGTDSDDQVLAKIKELHAKYCEGRAATTDGLSLCKELKAALDTRVAESSAEQRRHVALRGAAELDLKDHVVAVRSASMMLAGAAEPLIVERLEVLQSTGVFVAKLGEEKEVECPACGQAVAVDAFRQHVEAEREHLQELIEVFDTRKAAIGTLCDSVKSLKANLSKTDAKSWRDEIAKGSLADNFVHLDEIDAERFRASCSEEDLKLFEDKLLPLMDAAESASKVAPPDAQQISIDTQMVETGRAVIAAIEQLSAAARAEALVSFIKSVEQGSREELRLRSQKIVDEISEAMNRMWEILHPGEAIEAVRLYLPTDADKAIDIGLTFFGVEQESPRLTLSEGYRNSLGLCIFLAMAKNEADKDRPLFLDDVVVSLDRNHRGMIVELLEKEFGGRQVVILTHDREWYTELRQLLDDKKWVFKTLLPYETPVLGIRWSHKMTTFDDARAQLQERPDSAGNDARKIMDVELALIAERLQIRLPYLRAAKNDKRMSHDFLEQFVADGKKCFQKKVGETFEVYTDAVAAFAVADRLLVSWANRASHTFDVVRPEAIKLIDACEKALSFFRCLTCGKSVAFADAEGAEWIQCQCGHVRWRYGRA
jgi:DNA repair exonuclease SbcCD ATPase subunit/DNA-directed RNA polymerase subunit RPC12/RpoP